MAFEVAICDHENVVVGDNKKKVRRFRKVFGKKVASFIIFPYFCHNI